MNEYLLNLYELFSESDEVVFKALQKKKDWMFRKLYIPYNFKMVMEDGKETYPDIFSILDKTINFDDLVLSPKDLLDYEENYIKVLNAFNQRFKVRYLYEKPVKMNDESTFYMEIDFTKIDEKGYKELVANFFPCLKLSELDIDYNSLDVIELLKYAMIKSNHDKWVLILDKSNLLNNRFYADVFTKIVVSPKLNNKYLKALEDLVETLNVPIEVKDYD